MIKKSAVTRSFKNVAVTLKRRRRLSGVSQRELAKFAGIHMQQISNIERGKNSIPINRIHMFARKLRIDVNILTDAMIEDEREFINSNITENIRITNKTILANREAALATSSSY